MNSYDALCEKNIKFWFINKAVQLMNKINQSSLWTWSTGLLKKKVQKNDSVTDSVTEFNSLTQWSVQIKVMTLTKMILVHWSYGLMLIIFLWCFWNITDEISLHPSEKLSFCILRMKEMTWTIPLTSLFTSKTK